MTGEQIWGVVRTILAALGGFVVAKGYVDAATLNTILGGVGTIFVAAWSLYSNRAGTVNK